MTKTIYNDDVEAMVNPRSAQRQRRTQRRLSRKLTAMAVLLAVVLAVTMLRFFAAMPNAAATGISAPCAVVAAWLGGQVWEVCKR